MNNTDFSSLGLHVDLVKNILSLGYSKMTPIQAQTLPDILKGSDVIGEGKTGSGKTAAFSLGILNKLDVKNFRIQSLVLCPTRELADQVASEVRKIGRTIHNIKVLSLCGGAPFGPQKGSLKHGAHIIVGTPGRILEHINKGNLALSYVSMFVLDEADRMLDMGFQPAVSSIVKHLPTNRQTLLFTATFSDDATVISSKIMKDPKIIRALSVNKKSEINQYFYQISDENHRFEALKLILLKHRPESTIIFCETKKETEEVCNQLVSNGFVTLALHGDLDQKDRDQTLIRFSNNSVPILVATDVAARGIDIFSLGAVINYNIARNIDSHIHRIGRTGRAGTTGNAFSLFSEKERYRVDLIEKYLNLTIIPKKLPIPSILNDTPIASLMETIQIDGGKKQKIRAGDILGALTGEGGLNGTQVGKINIKDNWSFVAINSDAYKAALNKLATGKLKGKIFRVRLIRS